MEQDVESPREDDESEDEGLSISPLEIFAFLGHSIKRHYRLATVVAISIMSIGVAVAPMVPPTYETESRILAAQSAAIAAALSNPNRPTHGDNFDPFAGSTEILMQKSNLVWMVRQANVLARWNATRTLPFRIKDRISAAISEPVSDETKIVALAETLEKRMFVTHDRSVLTIHVYWRDSESVGKLAHFAQVRFLDIWREQELAAISAAITVNEDEAKRATEGIERALDSLKQVRTRILKAQPTTGPVAVDSEPRSAGAMSLPRVPVDTTVPAVPDKRLTANLAEIRQQERELETPWQRRLAELKFQLGDLRGTYGPEHPIVLQQESKIKQASDPPDGLMLLRQRERQLLSEIEDETAADDSTRQSSAISAPRARARLAQGRPAVAEGIMGTSERDDEPAVAPAKANLASAIQRYTDVTRRLETARLELVSSQVALQYRYVVVGEPEQPRKPTKAIGMFIALGSIVVGILVGLLLGAVRDLLSGRILEPWQAKGFGLPVLGELNLRHKAKS